jgi:hypothetical protein
MPVERWLDTLTELERVLEGRDPKALRRLNLPIDQLVDYYHHMQDLAKGYEKDSAKLEQQLKIIQGWQEEADQLKESLSALV